MPGRFGSTNGNGKHVCTTPSSRPLRIAIALTVPQVRPPRSVILPANLAVHTLL
jgi:hypothetical protein